MSKTNFVNGTIVEPEFLNAIFSHIHDGIDSDGHAPKIDPLNHISGISSGYFDLTLNPADFSPSISSIRIKWLKRDFGNIDSGISFPSLITLFFPSFEGYSNSHNLGSPIGDSSFPSFLCPNIPSWSNKSDLFFPITIIDNGNYSPGLLRILNTNSSRQIIFGSSLSDSGGAFWTEAVPNKGIMAFSVHYPLE